VVKLVKVNQYYNITIKDFGINGNKVWLELSKYGIVIEFGLGEKMKTKYIILIGVIAFITAIAFFKPYLIGNLIAKNPEGVKNIKVYDKGEYIGYDGMHYSQSIDLDLVFRKNYTITLGDIKGLEGANLFISVNEDPIHRNKFLMEIKLYKNESIYYHGYYSGIRIGSSITESYTLNEIPSMRLGIEVEISRSIFGYLTLKGKIGFVDVKENIDEKTKKLIGQKLDYSCEDWNLWEYDLSKEELEKGYKIDPNNTKISTKIYKSSPCSMALKSDLYPSRTYINKIAKSVNITGPFYASAWVYIDAYGTLEPGPQYGTGFFELIFEEGSFGIGIGKAGNLGYRYTTSSSSYSVGVDSVKVKLNEWYNYRVSNNKVAIYDSNGNELYSNTIHIPSTFSFQKVILGTSNQNNGYSYFDEISTSSRNNKME